MSNNVWKWWRGCGHKRKYALRSYALKKSNNMQGVEPYECLFCGFWHIGHNRRTIGSVKANTQQAKVSTYPNCKSDKVVDNDYKE